MEKNKFFLKINILDEYKLRIQFKNINYNN